MLHVPRDTFRRDGSLSLLITILQLHYYTTRLLPVCRTFQETTHNILYKRNHHIDHDDETQLQIDLQIISNQAPSALLVPQFSHATLLLIIIILPASSNLHLAGG